MIHNDLGELLLKKYVTGFVDQMKKPTTFSSFFGDEPQMRCPQCYGEGSEYDSGEDADGNVEDYVTNCGQCQGYGLLVIPYELMFTEEDLDLT